MESVNAGDDTPRDLERIEHGSAVVHRDRGRPDSLPSTHPQHAAAPALTHVADRHMHSVMEKRAPEAGPPEAEVCEITRHM
jgi:hypothetical protein